MAAPNESEIQEYRDDQPFLAYAECNWPYHTMKSWHNPVLRRYVLQFLSKRASHPFAHFALVPDCALPVVTGLHLAAFYGLVEAITPGTLPCIYSPLACGFTPFHFAAMSGNMDAFTALASTYGGSNSPNSKGQTPLHVAVEYRQTSFVQQLLAALPSTCGISVSRVAQGQVPLRIAAESLRVSVQSWLLSRCGLGPADSAVQPVNDVDINARDVNGCTPLMVACREKRGILYLIRDHLSDRLDMVRALCAVPGIQVNLRDRDGNTAFSRACEEYFGDSEAICDLLASTFSDLEINGCDGSGVTPFMYISRRCLVRTLKWMLTRSTHLLCEVDRMGRTALMHFCGAGLSSSGWDRADDSDIRETFELLVSHGGKDVLGAQDRSGNTAFLLIARWMGKRHLDNQLYFLRRLAELNPTVVKQSDKEGATALIHATSTGAHPEIVQTLLSFSPLH